MTVPSYQDVMLPVLKLASDGGEHKFGRAVEELADKLSLSTEERRELIPSGSQTLFTNRVGWALTYLKKAGLLESSRRGFFNITKEGSELVASNPETVDRSVLKRYLKYQDYENQKKDGRENSDQSDSSNEADSGQTPEDALALAYKKLRNTLESDILGAVKEASPSFFERLVVDLLVRMGYGGNRRDAGKALGRSGDGGIDGIINEDRLGLDVIYIQAKRWEGSVGRPEIQKFAGALQGKRARKGVFITTSSFTREAKEYASLIETRIILIDGDQLSGLMAEHDVGVSTTGLYEIKKLDSDYFDEA